MRRTKAESYPIVHDGGIIFSIAFSLVAAAASYAVQALTKPKPPRQPFDDRPTALAQRGSFLPLLFGRRQMGYLFLWAGQRKQEQGKGSSLYRESAWHGICVGPVDKLHAIYQGGKILWQGPITPDDSPSGTVIHLGQAHGSFSIFWGECDQPINDELGRTDLNRKGLPAFPGARSRWPGVCYIHWHDRLLGYSPLWGDYTYDVERRGESDSATLSGSSNWIEETTPANPVSGTTVYFNSGADIVAGTYTLTYIEGAMKYDDEDGTPFKLNGGVKYGWRIVDGNGKVCARCPGNSRGYLVQADCESVNAGQNISFVWAGGKMGLKLVDSYYADNQAGAPNPTFQISGASGPFSATGVVIPNVSAVGSADDGMNPAHVAWQLLTGAYPHGLGIPVDRLDVDAFEAMGVALATERLPVNFSTESERDIDKILGTLFTEIGAVMPQIGDKLVPRLIRQSSPGTIVTVTPDLSGDPKPTRKQIHGNVMPTRTTFYVRDRRRNYRASDLMGSNDWSEAASEAGGRVRGAQIELKTITDVVTGAMVAARRANEISAQSNTITFRALREAGRLQPGDAILLEGDGQYRVFSLERGLHDDYSKLTVVLDQYGMAADASSIPTQIPEGFGYDGIDNIAFAIECPTDLSPFVGQKYMLIMRVRESDAIDKANVLFSADDENFTDIGDAGYCTGGYLNSPIDIATTLSDDTGPSITVEGPDIDQVLDLTGRDDEYNAGRQLLYCEGEWFLLRKVTAVSGGWRLDGLTRAQFGSAAATHAPLTPVCIVLRENMQLFTSALLVSGSTRYARFQPKNILGETLVDADAIPTLSFLVS